jgi:hypothetical protein
MANVINAGSNSTGVARLVSDPEDLTSALLATLQIAGVTVNGQSVHAYDSAGNFFTPVAIAPGPNTFTVSAIDSLGNSVERTITLHGVDPAGSAVVHDVTNRADVGYQATTFNRLTRSLHVEQTLTNSGPSNLRATVTAAVDQISVASVDLTTFDGTLGDGRSFVDYDTEFTSGNLPPNTTSDQIPLAFANPDQARFSIDVSLLANGNRAPFFSSAPPVITSVGAETMYAVAVTDSDGDPLEFALLTAPDGMTIDAAGLVEWTPTTADVGVHSVRIQASDGHGRTAIQSFNLEVRTTLANRPPTFRSLPITRIDSGTDYAYTAEAIDADGHSITYSLPTAPAGMTIHPTSGLVAFDDPADGDYSVTILAVDGFGGQTEQTFVLTVGAVATNPGSPVILSTPVTEAVSGSLYLYLPLAQDPDGDTLAWSLVQSPTGMTINLTSGRIDWTPTSAQLGPHTVLVKVSDSNGGFATQLYTIAVSAILGNRAPLISSTPGFLGTQDTEYAYNLTALDLDGDAVTFALVSGPSGLTVTSAGAVRWTPTSSDLGVHRIKLRATDPSGASGLQTYDLEIRGPNTAPEFTSTPLLSGFAETIYRYDADAIDSEDDLRFSLLNPPSGMTIDASTGQVVWTPALSAIGSHSIIVRATDDRGLFTDQPYTLVVSFDDVPPVVALLMTGSVVNLGETIRLELRATDNVSVASRELTIDGVVQTLDGLHQVDYTASTPGIISVDGTATDSAGNIGTGTRTIRVLDPNDTTPPFVEITSPNPGSLPTYLTDIFGTATDDNLEFYRLEYSLSGADQWTTISEQIFRPGPGGTGVVNQNLGTFDPTMLANDSYDVRLMAHDTNGQQSFTRIELYVEAQAKLGNFRLEFTDLSIPVAGIPIEINRVYDTLPQRCKKLTQI